ncbi:dihydrolipoyl dehydrogenase family protein [Tellurirhabdus bombi]|uniref:dihydrolipoyl dehydrogenase family protein n=1 Tax=Tellurirhabdus bombi TaxID=2907205 RepID=UPI001F1F32F6|nr:NAD(P)/FAD-dependent oxidoreductase [Tellurirhabdus bombi]
MQKFDVVVIGTGSAGKGAADQLHEGGKTVAIIDKQPFGGTCSQRGCDPKKILVGAAEIVARSEELSQKGIAAVASIDWPALIRYKKTFTDPIPEKTEASFAKTGIKSFHGTASFLSANTIQVGDTQLEADYFVIASGSHPALLDIPGEELLIDSTGFMELKELPDRIVLVGGGYIAFEFAHVAARAGAHVTIVHRGELPLEGFDPDLVKLLVKATQGLGIQVLLNAKVTEIKGEAGQFSVLVRQDDKDQVIDTRLVVHAAGRPPDLKDLAVEKAGVDATKKGVTVNPYMQSVSNPTIYACGDAADRGLPLSPLASQEARLVATNILEGNQQKFPEEAIPSVVFTLPPLATVGLSEEKAREQGKKVKVLFQETTDWYTSKRINEPASGFKILIEEESDLIVGAHLLGSNSDELINIFTLAINQRIPASTLASTIFAYPTRASDLSHMLR